MATGSERLVLLDSMPTEMEAGVIVAALEQEVVQATITATHTAGFRAEAPGWVKILVAEKDLLRAQSIRRQGALDDMNIDWSKVDVGESTPDEPRSESTSWLASLAFWRRVAFVLIVLYLILLAVGILGDILGILLRLIPGASAAS